MIRRLVRVLTVTLGVLLAGYVAAVGYLYAAQRNYQYYPDGIERMPDPAGPAIEVVRLTTADGEHLIAWWHAPQEGRPAILFFQGNGDSLALQDGRWRRMADVGVGFLAVSYRGAGGSSGHPTEQGLHEDARAGWAWLSARVPPENIVIHGFSLGTGVAVKLASEVDARAVILEAPYTAAVDVGAQSMRWAPVRLLMKDRFLSRQWIGDVHEPLLIVHGNADSVIPFHFGRELFSKARQPKTFVEMVGSDHNTLVRDGLYDHVWTFLGLPLEGSTAYQGRPAQAKVTHDGL